MKKVLLGSTVLASAFALAGSALAGGAGSGAGLSVGVGGFIDFQAGFADQDLDTTGAASRDYKFQNDTEIHVTVEGSADNGLKYGAVIELNADINGDADGDGGNADKSYIYLESNAGRVELGGNVGAEQAMAVNAGSIARATGGISGDWYDFAALTGTSGAQFIVSPELPAGHGGFVPGAYGSTEDASKITYYTPRFSGLQVGVSFTPDQGDSGTAAGFTGELNGDQENVFGVGIHYSGEFDGIGVQAAAVGEFGDSETATTEDTSAYEVGVALSYQGFSVAGSWADWDDSATTVGSNTESEFWTLGAAYETGPFGVSVTYLDSERERTATTEDELTNLVVGADYQLAPGLVPYVEVSFFDADEGATTTADNDGTIVLIGAELNF